MSLVIGCPVFKRDWIIAEWYQYAAKAAAHAGEDPVFVLVGDMDTDSATFDVLQRAVGVSHEVIVVNDPECRQRDVRDWNHDRFHRMVHLRNRLLEKVREIGPDHFLSLDSDILLHPEAISAMRSWTTKWEAVGSKVYMTPRGTSHPSYAMLTRSSGMRRLDACGSFSVDVIMAVKLMTRAAYHIDYAWHYQGEDIGWSKACRKAGLYLGWVGGITSKHVMTPAALREVDNRCGY